MRTTGRTGKTRTGAIDDALSPNVRLVVEFFRSANGRIILRKESGGAEMVAHMYGRKACHDIAIALQDFYRENHLTQ